MESWINSYLTNRSQSVYFEGNYLTLYLWSVESHKVLFWDHYCTSCTLTTFLRQFMNTIYSKIVNKGTTSTISTAMLVEDYVCMQMIQLSV